MKKLILLGLLALFVGTQGCSALSDINCRLSGYEEAELEECDVQFEKAE